jgi:hypothetical protein
MPKIQVNGIELFYDIQGTGELLKNDCWLYVRPYLLVATDALSCKAISGHSVG